jgi:hypothetical protein
LDDLRRLIENGHIEKDITAHGITLKVQSLSDREYNWRDRYLDTSSSAALIASQRAATLAIATRALNGTPVETLFPAEKEELPYADLYPEPRFVVAEKLRKHYAELPRAVILALHNAYVEQVEKPSLSIGTADLKNS